MFGNLEGDKGYHSGGGAEWQCFRRFICDYFYFIYQVCQSLRPPNNGYQVPGIALGCKCQDERRVYLLRRMYQIYAIVLVTIVSKSSVQWYTPHYRNYRRALVLQSTPQQQHHAAMLIVYSDTDRSHECGTRMYSTQEHSRYSH